MFDEPYNEIVECLYVGGVGALKTGDDFSMIVNCTRNSNILFPDYCKNCVRIPIDDSPDDCEKLLTLMKNTDVLRKIHNSIINKETVLVHCFAGMQRSCALVACYLIQYYNITPETAIEYIKSKRKIAFFGEVNFLKAIQQIYFERTQNS